MLKVKIAPNLTVVFYNVERNGTFDNSTDACDDVIDNRSDNLSVSDTLDHREAEESSPEEHMKHLAGMTTSSTLIICI